MLLTLDDQRCDELGIDRDNRCGRRDAEQRRTLETLHKRTKLFAVIRFARGRALWRAALRTILLDPSGALFWHRRVNGVGRQTRSMEF
jgi:hypothetical protein